MQNQLYEMKRTTNFRFIITLVVWSLASTIGLFAQDKEAVKEKKRHTMDGRRGSTLQNFGERT